jgi:hypothetical protein
MYEDGINLREAVRITGTMAPAALADAAEPGYSPSILRMVARIKRTDPHGWHELVADLDHVEAPLPLPSLALDPRRTWCLSAEMVRQAFTEYASPHDVVAQLQLSRSSVLGHLQTLGHTFVIARRHVGRRVEFRIGERKAAA